MSSRRGFLTGLGASLLAAPAIVRAGSLMPVRAIVPRLSAMEEAMLLNMRMNELSAMPQWELADLYRTVPGLVQRQLGWDSYRPSA